MKRIRKADDTWLWCEIVGKNLLTEPAIRGVLNTLRDLTDRRELEEQLRYQATHDGLTNLPNRTHVRARLEEALAESAAHRRLTGLLFIVAAAGTIALAQYRPVEREGER